MHRPGTIVSPFRFQSTHHACPDEGDESGTSPPGFDSGVAKPLTVRLPNRFFGRRACRGRPPLVALYLHFDLNLLTTLFPTKAMNREQGRLVLTQVWLNH